MFALLKTFFNRSFLALFCTQYLGAFNDNFFRTAMATFITYKVTSMSAGSKSVIVSLAVALFMLPFFLFSALAGELADKFRKDILIKAIKGLEVVIVLLAGVGFLTTNVPLLLGILFLMGAQSAFFGPVKYSILPDILGEKQLISGNGIIEAGTYGSILQGTVFGGLIITVTHIDLFGRSFPVTDKFLPGIILVVAILGLLASLFIPAQKPANAALKVDKNFLRSTWKNMAFAKQNHDIFLCILGISWFWMLGTALVAQMPSLAHNILNGTPGLFTFLLTLFSCGIGLGSLLCQFLVKGEITSKYVPVSALLMTVFLADLACATSGYVPSALPIDYKEFLMTFTGKRITVDLLGFAICGGLYVVPLNAMLQFLAGEDTRSRVIATNNIINSLFMVLGSGFCALLLAMHFTIPTVFGVIAFANAIAAIYICGLLPHHIIRMILTRVLNFVYGVKVKGIEHWKNLQGNALIIANHTSFLDAVLLWVYIPGHLYFAIDTYVTQKWWIKPFLHLVKYFPIDPTNPMAVKSIIEEVKSGKRVVIFPEGRITTTGGLMKIYPGPAMIADKGNAQLLPICLEGSQYSLFSRFGTQLKTRPQSKITITIQAPKTLQIDESIKGKARRLAAARGLYDIMVNMKYEAGNAEETLFDSLLDAYELVGRNKRIINDATRKPLNFGPFLTAVFVLGKKIAKHQKPGEKAGFLLPNMTASVVAFFGMRAFNITPCMLNFSIGVKNMLACCKAAKITTIFTSKLFLRQGGLLETAEALKKAGIRLVYLEDLKKEITTWDKLVGLTASYFPRRYYKKVRGNVGPKDPAVVLFTSGSEGTPKGVVLSHENIQANRLQLQSVLDFGLKDRVFNAMPIFHSFGLTVGTLLPLLCGVPVFFYPSPLHYRIVPELIYDRNATIIFGTDTFFNGYAKMAHPYDFYSVRLAVVGAEKLKEETIRRYYDQFGLRIMEGYGATETAPVMAVNTPMYFKRGSVGRLLPGIEYKLEQMPGVEDGGKLLVKGANIMAGYLRDSNPGVLEPPQDGWYDTGDIVRVDEDGFVFILGRAKRFAKIAGEMISLTAVETEINALWPNKMHAVVNIPDEKKGEQLVLFSTEPTAERGALLAAFKEKGLSELAVPKTIRVVEEIPLMGTGKVDYVKLKEMAATNESI
ncbi:MAG: acyl-[Elusimicrobiaceae bacterium]|nr:acyl-[ACP]--phospholipid O-acyltransferase [Elusimicrobiaceae bacterium]